MIGATLVSSSMSKTDVGMGASRPLLCSVVGDCVKEKSTS